MGWRQIRSAEILWRMLTFVVVTVGVVWLAGKVLDRLWEAYGWDTWLQTAIDAPVADWVTRAIAAHSGAAVAAPYVVVPAVAAVAYYAYVRRRAGTAHEEEAEKTRLARELRREREGERRQRDINDLETLLESGRLALAKLERETERPRPSGSIGLATPLLPVTYRGFEVDEWSGYVIRKLKTMEPAELERYFVECVETRNPVERGRCYLGHLEKIISQLQ
jgi:hypothetical protein